MAIINFGSLNYDYVYQVPHFSGGNETIRSRQTRTDFGGSGLKQSCALAQAGELVYHAGLIGQNGLPLKDFLTQSSVNTDLLQTCTAPQGHCILQVAPNKERAALVYGGSNSEITPDFIDRCLESFGQGDFLLVQNEITNIPYLIDIAYEKGMRIIFNTSPVDEDIFRSACNKCEWLIMNDTECMEIADCDEVTTAFSKLQKQYPSCNILVTMGEEGSICYYKGNVYVQNAYPVSVADIVNSGDAFTGYFVAAWMRSLPIEECLDLASRAGAIAVSRPGGAAAFSSYPTLEQVRDWEF